MKELNKEQKYMVGGIAFAVVMLLIMVVLGITSTYNDQLDPEDYDSDPAAVQEEDINSDDGEESVLTTTTPTPVSTEVVVERISVETASDEYGNQYRFTFELPEGAIYTFEEPTNLYTGKLIITGDGYKFTMYPFHEAFEWVIESSDRIGKSEYLGDVYRIKSENGINYTLSPAYTDGCVDRSTIDFKPAELCSTSFFYGDHVDMLVINSLEINDMTKLDEVDNFVLNLEIQKI